MFSHKIKCEQGFTLLEVVIAILVFSVGIIAVASMQVTSIHNNSAAIRYTQASQLAANQAEQMMTTPYTTLASGGPVLSDDNVYTINWTVDGTVNNTRRITVTVAWQEKGRNRIINYDFIRTRDL